MNPRLDRLRVSAGTHAGSALARGSVVLMLTALTTVAVVAAKASACVPQPLIVVSPKSSGPPGAQVTVDGFAMNGLVEIRWNAIDGPLLAEGEGPVFSVPVTVPETDEGVYTLLALERDANGGLGSTARSSFEVTGGSGSSPPRRSQSSPVATSQGRSGSSTLSLPVATVVAVGMGLVVLGGIGALLLARRASAR